MKNVTQNLHKFSFYHNSSFINLNPSKKSSKGIGNPGARFNDLHTVMNITSILNWAIKFTGYYFSPPNPTSAVTKVMPFPKMLTLPLTNVKKSLNFIKNRNNIKSCFYLRYIYFLNLHNYYLLFLTTKSLNYL